MDSYLIKLDDAQTERLRDLAQWAGVSPEALMQELVEEWLRRPGDGVYVAASMVTREYQRQTSQASR